MPSTGTRLSRIARVRQSLPQARAPRRFDTSSSDGYSNPRAGATSEHGRHPQHPDKADDNTGTGHVGHPVIALGIRDDRHGVEGSRKAADVVKITGRAYIAGLCPREVASTAMGGPSP